MRWVWVAGLAGITVAVAIARPDAVGAIYQQLYPSDPAQRRALDQCFLEDHRFDRFDPGAREACYRHNPPAYRPAAAAESVQRPVPRGNFIDRWRAAGQGHSPQNDIRTEQLGERYLQPAAAASVR